MRTSSQAVVNQPPLTEGESGREEQSWMRITTGHGGGEVVLMGPVFQGHSGQTGSPEAALPQAKVIIATQME